MTDPIYEAEWMMEMADACRIGFIRSDWTDQLLRIVYKRPLTNCSVDPLVSSYLFSVWVFLCYFFFVGGVFFVFSPLSVSFQIWIRSVTNRDCTAGKRSQVTTLPSSSFIERWLTWSIYMGPSLSLTDRIVLQLFRYEYRPATRYRFIPG